MKVKIQKNADLALRNYFSQNIGEIEKWFTVLHQNIKILMTSKLHLKNYLKEKNI